MRNHVPGKQHTLWLIAAASAPIAHFSGCGWATALLTALVMLPVSLLPGKWDRLPGAAVYLQILWFGVVTGVLLKNSGLYWPSDNAAAVPLILLALAACTMHDAAPRVGAVLALCMALLALPVAFAGAETVEPVWLKPELSGWPAGLALALLLPSLPAAAKAERGGCAIGGALLALALGILVQGTISLQAAGTVEDPFYQTARTLGHMEPVAAAAMTLGWYALAVCLLQSAVLCAKGSDRNPKMAAVLATGTAAAFVLFRQQPDITILMVLSTFFWVLIPIFNKMKKTKKVLDKWIN